MIIEQTVEEFCLDTKCVKHLINSDEHLANIIAAVGSYSIKKKPDSFQALIEAIIYQQLNGNAASTICKRFYAFYGNVIPTPEQIISTSDIELRNRVGLSRMKSIYLKELATNIVEKKLNLIELPLMKDEEIISQLTRVKGIGRWTAEMFLIFHLCREDVLPVTDLGLRNAMKKTYLLEKLPIPLEMVKIAAPWRPYRSVATWYLWKSLSNFNAIG
jgi:DNA-3-methyladenine glycosylase II